MEEVHGNLAHAMRDNYNEHGVDEYYRKVASSYRNPFFPGIKKVIWAYMNRWWEAEGRDLYTRELNPDEGVSILDMAAGSGEATLCLLEWAGHSRHSTAQAIHNDVKHPLAAIQSAPRPLANVQSRPAFIPPNRRAQPTPLSTGRRSMFSGAHDVPDLPSGFKLDIVATDPYTCPAYTSRTSRPCHPLSFADLAVGQIPPSRKPRLPLTSPETGENVPWLWHMVFCSFALHLVATPSELFALLYELSGKAKWLVVIAPHKKPEIKEGWGWQRWDIAGWRAAEGWYAGSASKGEEEEALESEMEIVRDKVRLRVYRSVNI